MSNPTSRRRFFSSTTLERAVLEASGHYGVQPEELAYTKLEKSGVGSRGKVSIKVDPASPTVAGEPEAASSETAPEAAAKSDREAAPLEPAPQEAPEEQDAPTPEEDEAGAADEDAEDAEAEAAPAPESATTETVDVADTEPAAESLSDEMVGLPRTSAEARRGWEQASGPIEEAARKWTESLLRVASLDLEVEIYERDGELDIHLGGADAEVAVEDGGEVLRSMQHLLPRLMLGTVGNSVHCRVDCNDFRELHEERLRSQALSAAAAAVADQGEVTLDPMHPADRRIVHLALADNERVRTESLGRGFFKRVSIRGN